jgi:hypothetical protein
MIAIDFPSGGKILRIDYLVDQKDEKFTWKAGFNFFFLFTEDEKKNWFIIDQEKRDRVNKGHHKNGNRTIA